jgi:signal transduction histidine kinase
MILAIAIIVLLIIASLWSWWKYRSLNQLVKMLRDKVDLAADQGAYMKIESLPDTNLNTITQSFNNLIREVAQTRESLQEQEAQVNSRELLNDKIKEIENSISRLTVISAIGREITGSLNISEILETLYFIHNRIRRD